MNDVRLIRDYENSDLPLSERLPSLARRFPCLQGAQGLDPWSPDAFHDWLGCQENDSAAWHAGLLILNLEGSGPWDRFDAIAAIGAWDEESRTIFSSWARSWR